MSKESRFYIAKSSLYGLTVYDRESQTPAFEQGASTNMSEYKAIRLLSSIKRSYSKSLQKEVK